MILEQSRQDLKVACRALWRARAFSITAVLTLAVGIAGTTAMFALMRGVLLRPLPVRDQSRLVVAWKRLPSSGFAHYPFGDREIDAVGLASHLLESVAGVTANGVGRSVVVENGTSSYVKVALVTGGFFGVLGVEPIMGRSFTHSDDVEGAENVLVISHGLWQRRYGLREAIGRRVQLDEQPFTIVGVMPAGMDYPRGVEAWMTTRSVPVGGPFGDAAREEIDLLARLRTGVTLEQAASELSSLTQEREAQAPPNRPRGLVPVVTPLYDVVVGDSRRAIIALFVSVALVLLIASANAANLLLMRGEARRPELALRAVLGAARSRIVREIFAESLVLAGTAAIVGISVTWWTLPNVIALLPEGFPRIESVRLDIEVVLFTIGTAFITALLAGLAPAIATMRRDLAAQVRSGATSVTRSRGRVRSALVVIQVALAVIIVAAAGLLTRSLLGLQSVDTGIAAERLVFVDIALPQAKVSDRARHARFLDDVISRLEANPSIAGATPVNLPPFSGESGWDVPRFAAEGQSSDRAATNRPLNLESVYPNYFHTFEVPIVRGRTFTTADREGTPEVAIVSDDVAAETWPGENPIGKRLKMGAPDANGPWYTVVGVAASTRYRDLTRPRPTLYLPAAQFLMTAQMLALRTTAPLDLAASLTREAVRSVDPQARVVRIAPFQEMLRAPLARPRFNALLLGTFGMAALLLASVGIYGLIATYVRQRDREIAIRLALGASPASVRRLVLSEALRLGAVGVLLGLAGTVIVSRPLRDLLFGVRPLDPASLSVAAFLLLFLSVMASFVPAWNATRRDPLSTLRSD